MDETGGPLIVIVGPTATGKSDLAAALARELDGEIIGVDSIQVYRGLDAASAKPPREIREEIPHHLIDVADPGRDFSAGDFARMAAEAIDGIRARGRRPILAGGTGLYLRALLRGLAEMPRRHPELRERLRIWAGRREEGALHGMLRQLDPAAAERLPVRDTQRIVRAIEIALVTGRPLSDWIRANPFDPDRYRCVKIGLRMAWALLKPRIEARVEKFFHGGGLVDEVRGLLESGVPRGANCFKALGYREAVRHLEGHAGLDETIELVKRNTRRYAKRQLTWFRREPDLVWYDLEGRPEERFAEIAAFVAEKSGGWEDGDGDRQPG